VNPAINAAMGKTKIFIGIRKLDKDFGSLTEIPDLGILIKKYSTNNMLKGIVIDISFDNIAQIAKKADNK